MNISATCFTSKEIKALAENHPKKGVCDFSGSSDFVFDFQELIPFFDEFLGFFEPNIDGSSLYETIQDNWSLFTKPSLSKPILDRAAELSGHTSLLSSQVSYKLELLEPREKWDAIKTELITKRRFFSGELVADEDKWDVFFNANNVIEKDEVFYRGRINSQKDKIYSDEDGLGMPPPFYATAGRANVSGIPYLYLTKDIDTVMYECRASSGDHISIGQFCTANKISVVDFTFNPDLYHAFNSITLDLKTTIQQYLFFELISKDLSKPIRRYDNKDLDYLPTQFVCEYIRLVAGQKGIVFASSQHPSGKNLVLFDQNDVRFVKAIQKVVGSIEMHYE